jgi:hypothetical protein
MVKPPLHSTGAPPEESEESAVPVRSGLTVAPEGTARQGASADPAVPAVPASRGRRIHLCRRRALWVPTWAGWFMIFLVVGGTLAFFVLRIHPFLAVTEDVKTDTLIVEGWLCDDAEGSSPSAVPSGWGDS